MKNIKSVSLETVHTRSLLKEIKIVNNKDSFKNHVSTHGF